jgi:16S rRNA (guanine527-N7)-methyltransferase
VDFEQELARVLPPDVPERDRLVEKAARHLGLIVAANEYMNLTRITSPEEAAVKHVFDSIAPWRHFQKAKQILDTGTGAGFPGIPLSLVFPATRFTLAESIQKKARFVDSAVDTLDLPNVRVAAQRAEEFMDGRAVDIITARAVAPMARIIPLFSRALKQGTHLLLYKGPDVEGEIAEAEPELKKFRLTAEVLYRYELPDNMGARTLVTIHRI